MEFNKRNTEAIENIEQQSKNGEVDKQKPFDETAANEKLMDMWASPENKESSSIDAEDKKEDNADKSKRFEDYSSEEMGEMARTDPEKAKALNIDYQERVSAEKFGMSVEEYRDHLQRIADANKDEDEASPDAPQTVENNNFETTNFENDLSAFEQSNWDELTLDEKKAAISNLSEQIASNLNLENPPDVKYYNSDAEGDYGGYSASENTIYFNENNLDNGVDVVDTVAHESRHAWQHERAANPVTEQDYAFKENFENYINPEENYDLYSSQIVEKDAEEYGKSFSERVEYSGADDATLSDTLNEETHSPSYSELNPERGAVFEQPELPDDINFKKLDHYEVVDGKVGGRIPVEDYNEIREQSLHNTDADSMTLGKYRPTIREDGSADWSTPGLDSYNEVANSTGDMYFDLGSKWDDSVEEYDIDGDDMFELFNKPALDDAVQSGKEIRFCHDPSEDTKSLGKEWEYLKHSHGYDFLQKDGDYWYAKKENV